MEGTQWKVAAGSWSNRAVSPSCQHLQLHFSHQATHHQERRSSIVLPTLAGPSSHAADQDGDHLPQGNSFPHRQPLLKGVFPTELYCSGVTPSLLPHRELPKVSSHCPSQWIHSGFQKEWNKMPRNGRNWSCLDGFGKSNEWNSILQCFILLQIPWQIMSPWQTNIQGPEQEQPRNPCITLMKSYTKGVCDPIFYLFLNSLIHHHTVVARSKDSTLAISKSVETSGLTLQTALDSITDKRFPEKQLCVAVPVIFIWKGRLFGAVLLYLLPEAGRVKWHFTATVKSHGM